MMAAAVFMTQLAASWGLFGATIAFQRTSREMSAEIYVVDTLTGLTVNLTRNTHNDRFPSWSPDGESLVLQAFRPEQRATETIYRMPFTVNPPLEPLLPEGTLGVQPDWSPDGCCVAYSAYDNDAYSNNTFVVRLDDGHIWNASPFTGLSQFAPEWSPDGKRIAVAAGPVDGYLAQRILVFPVDTENGEPMPPEKRVSATLPGGYVTPSWSSAGDSLIFGTLGSIQGVRSFYRVPYPPTERMEYPPDILQVMPSARNPSYPATSPDGEWIVYSGTDSRDTINTVLYISRNDGTARKQLTFREGDYVHDTAPAWRPVRSTR